MAIIAISGRASSGKDTVGKMLQFLMHTEGVWDQQYYDSIHGDRFNLQVQGVQSNWQNYWAIKKYAGKLKQIGSLLCGIPKEKFEDQEFKNSLMSEDWGSMTYREFLQKLGTEAIRNNIHTNAWVNALFADYVPVKKKVQVDDVDERIEQLPNWIITDLRFPNEYEAVKQRKGICVRVHRFTDVVRGEVNGIPSVSFKETGQPPLHPSETALDNHYFDFTIENSGTLDDLKADVVVLYRTLKHLSLI